MLDLKQNIMLNQYQSLDGRR